MDHHRDMLSCLREGSSPKKHQIEGLNWVLNGKMEDGQGRIIADDMGLGKTFLLLCISLYGFKRGDKRRILIVSPLNVVENWKAEIEKHFKSFEDGGPLVSICSSYNKWFFDRNANIIIVNKDKLRGTLKRTMEYAWLFMGLKNAALAALLSVDEYDKIPRELKGSFTNQKNLTKGLGALVFDPQSAMNSIKKKFLPGSRLPFVIRPVSALWKSDDEIKKQKQKVEERKKKNRKRKSKKPHYEDVERSKISMMFCMSSDSSDSSSDSDAWPGDNCNHVNIWESDSESESEVTDPDEVDDIMDYDSDFDDIVPLDTEKCTGITVMGAKSQPPIFQETWDHVIFDEAHFARNSETGVGRASLCVHAKRKWFASGTPMQNAVSDFLMALLFVGCYELPPFDQWSRVSPRGELIFNFKNEFCLRRLKRSRDAAKRHALALRNGCEDAKRIEKSGLYVDMEIGNKYLFHLRVPFRTTGEREVYTRILEEAVGLFSSSAANRALKSADSKYIVKKPVVQSHVFKVITACRTCCISPCISQGYKEMLEDDPELLGRLKDWERLGSTKLYYFSKYVQAHLLMVDQREVDEYLLSQSTETQELQSPSDSIEQEERAPPKHKCKKMLVFSNFVMSLDLCSLVLDKLGIGHILITGKNANKRDELIHKFRTDPRVQIALISIKACSVGVNLVEATRVFFLDPWWNYSVEDQASDRAYRMGQSNDVVVTWLIIRGTIEEAMHDVAACKKLNAQGALECVKGLDLTNLRSRAQSVLGRSASGGVLTERKTCIKGVYKSTAYMKNMEQQILMKDGFISSAKTRGLYDKVLARRESGPCYELYDPLWDEDSIPGTLMEVIDEELEFITRKVRKKLETSGDPCFLAQKRKREQEGACSKDSDTIRKMKKAAMRKQNAVYMK
jgi:helicase-like protein/SNF2 domain-containing protein